MLGVLQTHRSLEYVLLTLGILIPALLIINTFEQVAPYLLVGLPVVLIVIYMGSRFQGSFILLYVFSSIAFLENEPGIQTIEIPFYALSLVLALYQLFSICRGSLTLETTLDKLFFFLLLLLPYGVILGILNGAALYKAAGEMTYFFGILLYFPLRKQLTTEGFRKTLQVIVLCIVAYVLVRNLINYRLLLVQAVLPWQAENARIAANEFILVFGACLLMSAAALAPSRNRQFIFTGLFLAMIGGLILTQSRGYWLAFIFGAACIFYVINRRGKIRILFTLLLVSTTSLLVAYIFFGDLLNLVLNALSARFQSIGSGKLDISLQERVLEYKTVFGLILDNPIAGYGMGYEYVKKMLVFDYSIRASYVHNGYLAAWFKLGLPGLLTFVSIWIVCIKESTRLYRGNFSIVKKVIALSVVGTVTGILIVNNTSPQVLTFESILFVSLFSAYLSTETSKSKAVESYS